MATAAYTRLSRYLPDQTSTRRQYRDCVKLAELRGFGTPEKYEDIESAYRRGAERPDYERLLADIRAGKVTTVIIWKIDRVARRLVEFMRFQQTCDKHGVTVLSVNDPYDTSTPIGRAIVQILAVFAELESATIALRVKSAKESAAAAGTQHGGGRPRFGYHRPRFNEDRGPAPCPTCGSYETSGLCLPAAEAIRDAAARVLAGESYGTIVADWTARGLLTDVGKPWTVRQVSSLLRRPHLAGLRVHRGEVVGTATWEPILDRTTHEALTTLRRGPSLAPRRTYLLTGGTVACGREGCGGPLRGSGEKGQRAYRCWGPPKGEGCGRLQVMAEPLERFVTDATLGALARPEVRRALRAGVSTSGDEEREVLTALADAEGRLIELGHEYGRGLLPMPALIAATATAQEEIDTLGRRAKRLATQRALLDIPEDNIEGEWFNRDLTWRAAIIRALFETPLLVLPAPPGWGKKSPVAGRVVIVPRV